MGLEVATIAAIGAAASGAAAIYSAVNAPKPQAPTVQAAVEPPQAAKNPDVDPLRKKNANAAAVGPMAGPSSTMLTGSGGVDPSSLSLGKTTLLGG